MSRFWALFIARNKEFYRDRGSLTWAIVFPFMIILAFSFIFERDDQALYKVGVLGDLGASGLEGTDFLDLVAIASEEEGLDKLAHHRLAALVDARAKPPRYWVSETSPDSALAEKLITERWRGPASPIEAERLTVTGNEVPYLDWLFPGVLGMNMMFAALFGVGYVIVRYRRNGVLKRLSVTPLSAFEFLASQLASRIFVVMTTTTFLYAVCVPLFGFTCKGSHWVLAMLFAAGGASMVALGLLVAARTSSEELAGGLLNLISWPMMLLCEVWFSMEGAAPWIQRVADALPLTHLVRGARAVMNDGAGLETVWPNLAYLLAATLLALAIGSWLFHWEKR